MEQRDIYKQLAAPVITALDAMSVSWNQQITTAMKEAMAPLNKQIQVMYESIKLDYSSIFAEQLNILKHTIISDDLAKMLDHHRINSVKRFVQSSDFSPRSQDVFMHRYHVLSEVYRGADKADTQSDNRTPTRKRRVQTRGKQHVPSIAYWDTSDSVILRRRLDCVNVLAFSTLDVATAFFGAYDTFARKDIDYRRHTLSSMRTVTEQLIIATGKGIDTADMKKELGELGVLEREYTHKKTRKINRKILITYYNCYSKTKFGQTTVDELEEFSRQLDKLHDANINLNDDQLAALLQRMETFICDMFACWYTLGQTNLPDTTPTS